MGKASLFHLLSELPIRQWKYEGKSMRSVINFLRNEEAATAVEYAVMLALILGVILGTIGSLGMRSGGMWGGIRGELQTVGFVK